MMSALGYLLSVMRDSQNEPRKWEDQPSFGALVKSGRVPKVIEFVLHAPSDVPRA
jgi:hypothetical protein